MDDDRSARRQYYLIMLPVSMPNPKQILKQIFQLCWNRFILDVNVLVEDRVGIVKLYTYFPFTQKGCRDTTPVIHNRFINGHFELSKITFPSKASNLWGCPVKFIAPHLPPYIAINRDRVSGVNVDILDSLAEKMNFTLEIIIYSGGSGKIYPNGTSTGIFSTVRVI